MHGEEGKDEKKAKEELISVVKGKKERKETESIINQRRQRIRIDGHIFHNGVIQTATIILSVFIESNQKGAGPHIGNHEPLPLSTQCSVNRDMS